MPKRYSAALFSLFSVLFCAWSSTATATTFAGYFDDPTNTALVGSDLGAALFVDDFDIANNVALYAFNIGVAGTVSFESKGYTAGGAEPYLSLFMGTGASATFLESNFFNPDIDFILSIPVVAGDYMIALGVWENMSFAENSGAGTLGDGFIGLGGPGLLGDYYYELEVSLSPGTDPGPGGNPIPEPSAMLLFAIGAGVIGHSSRLRTARPRRSH